MFWEPFTWLSFFSPKKPQLVASNHNPNTVKIHANLDLVNESRIAKGLAPYKTQEELVAALNKDSTLKYEAVDSNYKPPKT